MTAPAGPEVGAGLTAPAAAEHEPRPRAEYVGGVLRRVRVLPPLDLDLTEAYGNVLAADVVAPHPFPAFDHAALDGYAMRYEDIALPPPTRLNVVGDLG